MMSHAERERGTSSARERAAHTVSATTETQTTAAPTSMTQKSDATREAAPFPTGDAVAAPAAQTSTPQKVQEGG